MNKSVSEILHVKVGGKMIHKDRRIKPNGRDSNVVRETKRILERNKRREEGNKS